MSAHFRPPPANGSLRIWERKSRKVVQLHVPRCPFDQRLPLQDRFLFFSLSLFSVDHFQIHLVGVDGREEWPIIHWSMNSLTVCLLLLLLLLLLVSCFLIFSFSERVSIVTSDGRVFMVCSFPKEQEMSGLVHSLSHRHFDLF